MLRGSRQKPLFPYYFYCIIYASPHNSKNKRPKKCAFITKRRKSFRNRKRPPERFPGGQFIPEQTVQFFFGRFKSVRIAAPTTEPMISARK
jgi:hypothetical protein